MVTARLFLAPSISSMRSRVVPNVSSRTLLAKPSFSGESSCATDVKGRGWGGYLKGGWVGSGNNDSSRTLLAKASFSGDSSRATDARGKDTGMGQYVKDFKWIFLSWKWGKMRGPVAMASSSISTQNQIFW